MRVGVFGAGGRMGSTVCQAVAAEPDLTLVAAVDPYHSGIDLREATGTDVHLQIAPDADALSAADAQVAVDFTELSAARENLRWCAAHGVHAVVGTTGFTDDDYDEFSALFGADDGPNCLIAPNFAIGAVLMMRMAEMAAPFFETGEIVEMHHDGKVDAPSGTAVLTAERMAAASADWAKDPTSRHTLEHARGSEGPAGIRLHAIRMRGTVAHQEVILGTTGQTLSIRHDSFDRTSFMPGVVLAVKAIAGRPGLTVGLDTLLDL